MPPDVPVRAASTVIVLRDSDDGPEVFLVRRHHAIAFMAGAHVFPGGRVDEADRDADPAWCDMPSGAAGSLEPDIAFRVAALRELFEEAGVLLARDTSGGFVPLLDPIRRARFDTWRHDVHSGARRFRDVVLHEGLRLALDSVVPFAHWVTPPIEVRRFDTWFFVTRAPGNQNPAHEPTESTDGVWLTASRALALASRGEISLPPPTWATLRELEPFASAGDAIERASGRRISTRQPRLLQEGNPPRILLPGDPEHPSGESLPVPFETRFVLVDGRWYPDRQVP